MNPVQITCIEAKYAFTALATERQITLGETASGYGSLIYSLKSNQAAQNMSDIAGKRLGVGQPLGAGSFLLGAKVVI